MQTNDSTTNSKNIPKKWFEKFWIRPESKSTKCLNKLSIINVQNNVPFPPVAFASYLHDSRQFRENPFDSLYFRNHGRYLPLFIKKSGQIKLKITPLNYVFPQKTRRSLQNASKRPLEKQNTLNGLNIAKRESKSLATRETAVYLANE